MDRPLEERRFTDREVREILKKAVEQAPSRGRTSREGFTLGELKAIGREVGIAPARLEEAARAVALEGGRRPGALLGAPTVLDVERRVEGELERADTPEVLSLIRRTMGQQGEVEEVGGSLEWSAGSDAVDRYVTLSSKEGTTTIRGSANLSNAVALTYLPAGLLGLMASLVGLAEFMREGSITGLVVFLTVLPVLYPILRTVLGKISRAESARLNRVVDDLAQRIGEGVDRGGPSV